MHDFTLVSYKMIRVDYNQFDKHFWFFHYVCLSFKTNFSLLYTGFKNLMCNGLLSFVRKICFIQACRWTVKNCHQWRKVGGASRFSFYICRYIKEIIMLPDLLHFFQKNSLDIINEYFWNSPSKQMKWKINNR